MRRFQGLFRSIPSVFLVTLLVACGGGGDPAPDDAFTIGGQLSGLVAGQAVTIENNATESLTLNENGTFIFPTAVPANAAYAVSVRTQPAGQRCTVSLGTGIATANVSSVRLTCENVAVGAINPVYLADTYREGRADLLAQANAQGANGYAYLTGFASSANDFINLYVKDLATTYTWEALDLPTTVAGLQAQLNAQGARGFAHSTFLVDSVVYARDAAGRAPFSYELLPSQTTSAAFLAQADAQGARGLLFAGDFAIGGSTVSIYSSDSSNARYRYSVQITTTAATPEDFLAQANAQGQQGYRFIGEYVFSGNPGNDAFRNVYVRDTSQSATFDHRALPATSDSSALVTQANSEGERGSVFHGPVSFFADGFSQPGVVRNLYVRPINCSGNLICRPGSPL